MKLKLADLECDQLVLRSEESPPTILQLQNISDGCGELEFREGLTLLQGLALRSLLAILEFPIGTGRLFTDHPATISHVSCEGRVRNGFAGELRAAILESEGVCFEMDGVRAKGHLLAEGLWVKLDGRGGRVEVGSLALKEAQVTVGSLLIRLGALSVSGLKVAWDTGRPRIDAIRAHAKDLQLQWGDASIDIAAIDVPEGLRVHDQVQVQQILIGAVELAVHELRRPKASETSSDAGAEGGAQRRGGPKVELPKASAIELDYGVFDTVNGNIDVDATLSVTLPVIGKRVATHHFRIPVDGGIMNYRDFERGLADLEDTFIDIRLRKQKLVIERDIPLIPGLRKSIITWDLSPGDVSLASRHLVRLATLPHFKLADTDEDEERSKKPKVKLHRLDFDNIAVHLSLDETAVLKSGEGSLRAHLDELDLVGQLHFDPAPEVPVSPTSLGATAKGLGIEAHALAIAGHILSASLTIGSVASFQMGFDDLRPMNLDLALKNISVTGVQYDLEAIE